MSNPSPEITQRNEETSRDIRIVRRIRCFPEIDLICYLLFLICKNSYLSKGKAKHSMELETTSFIYP